MGHRRNMRYLQVIFYIGVIEKLSAGLPSERSLMVELDVNEAKNVVSTSDIKMDRDGKGLIDPKKSEEDEKKKDMILTRFELSILRCCSSSMDTHYGRCFEVNGVGGINFSISPCQYLNNVISKLSQVVKNRLRL